MVEDPLTKDLAFRRRLCWFQPHHSSADQPFCPLGSSASPPGPISSSKTFSTTRSLKAKTAITTARRFGHNPSHNSLDLTETSWIPSWGVVAWETLEKPRSEPSSLSFGFMAQLSPAHAGFGCACCPHQPKCLQEQLAMIPKIFFSLQVMTIQALS